MGRQEGLHCNGLRVDIAKHEELAEGLVWTEMWPSCPNMRYLRKDGLCATVRLSLLLPGNNPYKLCQLAL